MQSSPDQELTKRIHLEIVPDLTKALRLIKTRFTLLLRIIKHPFQDYRPTIHQMGREESDLISKYQQVDRGVLMGFQMEFQRLFCRVIETVQLEKKTPELQDFIAQIESIIYDTIANQTIDYIKALASIYGRGRATTKILLKEDKAVLRQDKHKQEPLLIPREEKRILEGRERSSVRNYSCTIKIMTELDLDYNYTKDSYLYMMSHQESSLSDMVERNKAVAADINYYKRMHGESALKKEKRAKGRKLVPTSVLDTTSSTRIPSATIVDEKELSVKQENSVSAHYDMLVTGSVKHHPAFSLSKQNRKCRVKAERKTSESFRLVQMNISTRQVTPKKILFTFNGLSSKDGRGMQFSIRKKNKQCYQTKSRFKDEMLDILIQGRKIEEDLLELGQTKKMVIKKKSKILV